IQAEQVAAASLIHAARDEFMPCGFSRRTVIARRFLRAHKAAAQEIVFDQQAERLKAGRQRTYRAEYCRAALHDSTMIGGPKLPCGAGKQTGAQRGPIDRAALGLDSEAHARSSR